MFEEGLDVFGRPIDFNKCVGDRGPLEFFGKGSEFAENYFFGKYGRVLKGLNIVAYIFNLGNGGDYRGRRGFELFMVRTEGGGHF